MLQINLRHAKYEWRINNRGMSIWMCLQVVDVNKTVRTVDCVSRFK